MSYAPRYSQTPLYIKVSIYLYHCTNFVQIVHECWQVECESKQRVHQKGSIVDDFILLIEIVVWIGIIWVSRHIHLHCFMNGFHVPLQISLCTKWFIAHWAIHIGVVLLVFLVLVLVQKDQGFSLHAPAMHIHRISAISFNNCKKSLTLACLWRCTWYYTITWSSLTHLERLS